MPTIEETTELIIEKIHWFRKGTADLPEPIPNYKHSIGVYKALKKHWFNDDVQMAWLLHDIIEDSWTKENNKEDRVTFKELKELWYNDYVLNLIDLSTHDIKIEWSFEKWQKMLERLIKEDNKEARAVKLADISNNLLACHLMPNKEKLDNS